MRVDRQHWERIPAPTLAPAPITKPAFLERAFAGRIGPDDLVHIARAVLSLSDENAELRQRIVALEMAFKEMRGGVR